MLKPIPYAYQIEGVGLHNDRVDGLLLAREIIVNRMPNSFWDQQTIEHIKDLREILKQIDRLIDQNK